MTSVIRIGFIGAGCVNFGGPDGPWDHATRLETIPNVYFVGIADPNKERCRAVLDKRLDGCKKKLWEECRVFSDFTEMIAETKPDAVFIGVPPFCHGSSRTPMELTCVQAGVDCFVEKPLANASAEDTLHYAQQVQNDVNKPIVSVGYMFRRAKWVRHLRELVEKHGKPIVCFHAHYNCAYVKIVSPFWWDSRFSGGPIVEQATHFIDLARYLVGEVDESTIHGWSIPANEKPNEMGHLDAIPKGVDEPKIPEAYRIPRSTVLNWKFQSGAIGSLVHAALLQADEYDARLEVLADGLRIRVERPYSTKPSLHILRGSSPEEVVEFPDDDPYLTEVKEFVSAIRARLEGTLPHSTMAVSCTYLDGAKTYALTCKMREASSHKPRNDGKK